MSRMGKVGLYICLSIIITSNLLPLRVFAYDRAFYAGNDINFYNPDDNCNNSTPAVTAGADTVTSADKQYGSGPVTPGAGHNWKPAIATSFGGPGEYQGTSFGGNTKAMDDAGVFYFAILPKDYKDVKANPNTPKEIVDAVKSGALKPKGKLIFKKGDKYAIGVWLDVGPGATGGGRWLDLGQSLAHYLVDWGHMEWDFVGGTDSITTSATTTTLSTPSKTSATTLVKASDKTKQIFQLLITGGFNSVQAAAVMGNMQAESGFNSDGKEVGGGGYGLVQWTGGRRTNLEKFALSKSIPNSDIPMQIEFLFKEYNSSYKKRLSGTAFDNATNVDKATEAWMDKFESPAKATNHLSRRIQAANEVYGLYKDLAPAVTTTAATSTSATNCAGVSTGGSSVAVSSNIVATAQNFALKTPAKDGMNKASDATPAYVSALAQYNPGGVVADCGVFVATVMIASGLDKDYPKAGTSEQYKYIKSHPEKYTIIESPKTSDLQPGDILLRSSEMGGSDHHTAIYTGDTGFPMIDASQDQRVPGVRDSNSLAWMLRIKPIVARLIK